MTNDNRLRLDNRFSQIPHWVTFSGISDGAFRLYAVLYKYADTDDHTAFPSRTTLAQDIQKTAKSVDRYIKELVSARALRVTRRKRKGSKQNYTNLYTVITANPNIPDTPDEVEVDPEEVGTQMSPGGDMDVAENNTQPNYTQPSLASKQSSDDEVSADPAGSARYQGPGELPLELWNHLLEQVRYMGTLRAHGYSFYSDQVQGQWGYFTADLEEHLAHLPEHDALMHQILNQEAWTIDAPQATYDGAKGKLRAMIGVAVSG